MTCWHLTNKFKPFVMKILAGYSKLQFLLSRGTFSGNQSEKFEHFLSVSKIEPPIFGFLTKLFLRGSQYYFLLARRKTLMKEKVLLKKVFWTFISILLFWTLSETKWPSLLKSFRFVCQNCNLRDLKHVVEKNLVSKIILSLSFCFICVRDWTKPIAVSPKQSAGLLKQHSMYPEDCFLEKKEFFGENLFFVSLGHGAEKLWLFVNFFPAVVPKLPSTCP